MAAIKELPGSGVPADKNHPIDPTKNVLDLVEAERRRQDDLREMQDRLITEQIERLQEMAKLRADHSAEMRRLESDRLDKIRQVDVSNAAATAAQLLAAVQTLAATTTATAETLRSTVGTTAAAMSGQNDRQMAAMLERVALLEKSSYTGAGKQAVADPMMAEMVAELKALRAVTSEARGVDPFIRGGLEDLHKGMASLNAAVNTTRGKRSGIADTWMAIGLGLSILMTLVTLGTFVFITMRPSAAPTSVIYTPAPAGTQLPSTPPSPIPR